MTIYEVGSELQDEQGVYSADATVFIHVSILHAGQFEDQTSDELVSKQRVDAVADDVLTGSVGVEDPPKARLARTPELMQAVVDDPHRKARFGGRAVGAGDVDVDRHLLAGARSVRHAAPPKTY